MTKELNPKQIPDCPECERLHEVSPFSQKIGEFLEWLQSEKGIVLGTYHEHDENCYGSDSYRICGLCRDELYPTRLSIEQVLAEFFEIDLTKVENERRALLESLGEEDASAENQVPRNQSV